MKRTPAFRPWCLNLACGKVVLSDSVGGLSSMGAVGVGFFARRPLVHVTWSCSFIILRWEGENLHIIPELGRCPLRKWNRWKDLERIYWSIGRIMVRTNNTARARPARNPGTPPARCPETRQRKQQKPTITIQRSKKEIYMHPTVSCRDTFQWIATNQKTDKENAGVKH